MKEYVIKQLRELSHVRGKQKTWVAELTDEQLYEVFLGLRNGEAAKSIAREIKQSWDILPDSTTHSLSQGVLKFKKRISHLLLTLPLQESELPADDTELDTLEKIERITMLQADRIQKIMAEERKTGVRYSNLSKELQSLSALTKALIKSKDFSIKHGTDPIETKRRERMERRIDRRFKNLMSGLTDDSKSAMVEAADRFLQLCEEDALILHVDKDGRKRLVKPGENMPQ